MKIVNLHLRYFARNLFFSATALILSCPSPTARACAVIGIDAHGQQYVVSVGGHAVQPAIISSEKAVIVWDDVHKIEHFIREADITTPDPHVGFLVPTPETPELAQADSLIFALTAQDAAPKIVPETIDQTPLEMMSRITENIFNPTKHIYSTISSTLAVAASGSASVQVVNEQDVGDYHAVTLAADDAAALSQWLKDNGYAWSKDAESWLKTYVAAKWKITAFKLAKAVDQHTDFISTHAIRMSFPTDRPFFPYSEPGDTDSGQATSPAGRMLDVAFLSNSRVDGVLANGKSWQGKVQYSGPMESPNYNADQILAFAKLDNSKYPKPPPSRLTYFRDSSNPRPGTADLYFSPSSDQSPVTKTVIDYSLPKNYRLDLSHPLSDIMALLIVGCLVLLPLSLLIKVVARPAEETRTPRTW